MKNILITTALLCSKFIIAQTPEDALRSSFNMPSGSARNLAIGGAMGSLGGDINVGYVNPAGLGFYKTGEFVLSPGLNFGKNKINYRGELSKNDRNSFNYGTSGLVTGWGNESNGNKRRNFSRNVSEAVSITINQTANFNRNVNYGALNNFSSFTEQWAEQVASSRLSLNQIMNTPAYAFGAGLGVYSYAVDTFRVNGVLKVKGSPEIILDRGEALRQDFQIQHRGGVHELALSYGVNKDDKWLFGASVGIPILYHRQAMVVFEKDTSNKTNNFFHKMEYRDNITTSGVGITARLGAIYRPTDKVRLGLALHTPNFYGLRQKRDASINTTTETASGVRSTIIQNSLGLLNNVETANDYGMRTAWKAIASGSYVFREISDVRKQRAFLTADIEYVRHSAGRFYSTAEEPSSDEKAYFKRLGKAVADEYKGNFNFRVGGELKFNTIMGRLGFAYNGNPYRDPALKANRINLSGGLGYRHKGIFIDLTYVHSMTKDVNFAYRLQNSPNTFASIKQTNGMVMLTFGNKF